MHLIVLVHIPERKIGTVVLCGGSLYLCGGGLYNFILCGGSLNNFMFRGGSLNNFHFVSGVVCKLWGPRGVFCIITVISNILARLGDYLVPASNGSISDTWSVGCVFHLCGSEPYRGRRTTLSIWK